MITLTEHDRAFITNLVVEALTVCAPEEVPVYEVTSDDILSHITMKEPAPSDSDAFFGGLSPSLGELLSHILALIAVELMKHGWTMTRATVLAHMRRTPTPTANTPLVTAHEQLRTILERDERDAPTAAGDEATLPKSAEDH